MEDDFISSASRARIHSRLGKGARLWSVVMSSIHLFRITHFTFISTLCFHFGLIQPLAFSIFMCECGHELDTSSAHLAHCLFGNQRIITHMTLSEMSCMPLFERMDMLYGENGGMPLCQKFHNKPIS